MRQQWWVAAVAITWAIACGGKVIGEEQPLSTNPGSGSSGRTTSGGTYTSSSGYGGGSSGSAGASGTNPCSATPEAANMCGGGSTSSGGYYDPPADAGVYRPFHSCTFDNPGKCSDADDTTWRSCVAQTCEATRSKCFGDFETTTNGQYGGACGSFITCEQQCGCSDLECFSACAKAMILADATGGQTCSTCLGELATCTASCTYPACRGIWHSCSQLAACCPKLSGDANVECANITAAGYADDCNMTYPQLGCP